MTAPDLRPSPLYERLLPWTAASAVAVACAVVAEGITAAVAGGRAGDAALGAGDLLSVGVAAAAAHGLLWGGIGVLAALLHAPVDSRVSLRALGARVWHDTQPPRTASRIYAAAAVVVPLSYLLYRVGRLFLTAFRNEQLAAAALAVALVALAGLHALLFAILAGALERGLATRRDSWIARGRGAVAVMAALALLAAGALMLSRIESVRQIPWGGPILGLVLLAVLLATRELLIGGEPRFPGRWKIAAALTAGGVVLASGGYALSHVLLPHRPAAIAAATGDTLILRRLMPLLQGRDSDGDGFRPALGGGDCDDTDPEISPGAVEIPDNGVDEDCDGRDLSAGGPTPESAPVPESAPAVQMPTVRNVLLITVDTLRGDRLGAYGYLRDTTPHLDALAEESVRWANAYAPASFTPKSVPTMLSSRHPGEIHRNYGHFAKYLPPNLSIAEVLHDAGFRTAGFGSHWYFRSGYGFDQGFETWDTSVVPADSATMETVSLADALTSKVVAYLEEHAEDDKRFLVWVHYLDPHKLYAPPAEFDRFGPTQEDKYDGEVAYTDAAIGRLLKAVAALPSAGETAIIFTTDHGEAFGEHGLRFHGHHLWEEVVRVPWIIHVPAAPDGVAGRVVDRRVGLVDLAPTILDLVDVHWPADGPELRGVSLVPEMLRAGALPPRPIWIDHPPGPYNEAVRAFIHGDLKLHHYVAAGRYRLYDLATDPLEKTDLYGKDPERDQRVVDRYKLFLAGLDEIRVDAP